MNMYIGQRMPWRLQLKDREEEIALTAEKAKLVREWLHSKHERYLDIHDENGNFLETIEKGAYKRLYERKYTGRTVRSWKCDYGNRHECAGIGKPAEVCECSKYYNNMSALRFWKVVTDVGGFSIRYIEEITKEHQEYVSKWIVDNAYDNRVSKQGLSVEEVRSMFEGKIL